MRTETNLQTGEVTVHEDAPVTYTPPTQAEIDAEKTVLAEQAASSPSLDAAIEEFSEILTTASISIPANVKANITARIKTKL